MRPLLIICLWGISVATFAQNRLNYSQYMHNHLAFNPGYTEFNNQFGASLIYRNQWTGFTGAPKTQVGNAFYNIGKTHAISVQFRNDQITAFKSTDIGLGYAVNLNASNETSFSFGIRAGYMLNSNGIGQETFFDNGDPILINSYVDNHFNFGAGLFVRNPQYYFGIGLPYLLKNNNISLSSNGALEYNHAYITGGYMPVNNERIKFYPSILAKVVSGAPVQFGADLNFIFNEKVWTSLGYRNDVVAVMSLGYIFKYDIKLVYSYDLGFSVTKYGGSTHEISIGFGMSTFTNKFSQRQYLKKRSLFFKGGGRPVK